MHIRERRFQGWTPNAVGGREGRMGSFHGMVGDRGTGKWDGRKFYRISETEPQLRLTICIETLQP